MPVAFDAMAADQVGCVVEHGDAEYEVGPLGPGSDPVEIKPNSYTLFRFGRTALSLIVVAERERDKATMGLEVASISNDPVGTLVHQAAMQASGNPGYEIRCWAGST